MSESSQRLPQSLDLGLGRLHCTTPAWMGVRLVSAVGAEGPAFDLSMKRLAEGRDLGGEALGLAGPKFTALLAHVGVDMLHVLPSEIAAASFVFAHFPSSARRRADRASFDDAQAEQAAV